MVPNEFAVALVVLGQEAVVLQNGINGVMAATGANVRIRIKHGAFRLGIRHEVPIRQHPQPVSPAATGQ